MASIREVAQKAHVGVGTVSRALNGSGYVSADAKKRIDQAIEELHYMPNELARNFYRNRTGIIGVVIPNLDHPFFSKFTMEVEMELYRHGYKTLVCNTIGISNREQEYLEMLDRSMVDGIITGSHSLDDSSYLSHDKPIVSLDHDFGGKIPLISSDHKKGGRLAAEVLLADGCKHVIQFAGSTKVRTPANDRHVTFTQMMQEHGVQVQTVESAWNRFTFDYFQKTMEKFMKKYTNVDGIFTADLPAICCLNYAKKYGRKVPEDLKIVSYDAMEITQITDPCLTAVRQDVPQLAKACVHSILALIEGKPVKNMRQIFDVSLQRGGTA
ncbi:MAG TPA: LacI family transcriptional regulator [Ruminococcaceae bacterium]|nr:LacI family transcriptional regulator [Oscillospiraceae bacterium]HCM22748.1 LacI family transcriptional regulator [Oscillospiraceae bacterium]